MDMRRRGYRSLPSRVQEYTTKRELAERRSHPQCPPLLAKTTKKRISPTCLFEERSLARAVFFKKPVGLSKSYNPNKEQSYFEQIFAKNIQVGEGSFGVVFKVKSREDDKLYAVKQMKSSHHLHYGYAEVENYEKVGEHSNCVKFFMAWEELKIIHIQMEFCQLSLAQYAQTTHTIGESQLWEILYDMLKALDHLHTKNLIHLDVKPGNIMISKGFYKLGDFGLLVDLNQHDGRKISTISDGDAKYLACEVLEGIYTYSCDIFGLGISLLELATNIELPEFGPLWHEIRKQYLPSAFYNGVTPQFASTVEEMMSNIYSERPQASKILGYSTLKKIQEQPRINCYQGLCDDNLYINKSSGSIENNNIIDTPRRPLYEIRNSLGSGHNIKELHMDKSKSAGNSTKQFQENNSSDTMTHRQGLVKVKLVF